MRGRGSVAVAVAAVALTGAAILLANVDCNDALVGADVRAERLVACSIARSRSSSYAAVVTDMRAAGGDESVAAAAVERRVPAAAEGEAAVLLNN